MSQLSVVSSTAAAESAVILPSEAVMAGGKVAEAPARVTAKSTAADPMHKTLSAKERDGILQQLNKTLEAFDTHVSLSVDDKSHQTVIKVVDNESGKVVRQIPSEQLMRISERITELLGVIYDEKM